MRWSLQIGRPHDSGQCRLHFHAREFQGKCSAPNLESILHASVNFNCNMNSHGSQPSTAYLTLVPTCEDVQEAQMGWQTQETSPASHHTWVSWAVQCLADCRDKISEELGISPEELELSMGMSGDFEPAVSHLQITSLVHKKSNMFAARKDCYISTEIVLRLSDPLNACSHRIGRNHSNAVVHCELSSLPCRSEQGAQMSGWAVRFLGHGLTNTPSHSRIAQIIKKGQLPNAWQVCLRFN